VEVELELVPEPVPELVLELEPVPVGHSRRE